MAFNYAAIVCNNKSEVFDALQWLEIHHPEVKWCTGNENTSGYTDWTDHMEYAMTEDDEYALFFEAGSSMFIRCKEYVRATQNYSPDDYITYPLFNEGRKYYGM